MPSAFDWSTNPRIGRGHAAVSFRALTAWGQLYEHADKHDAPNTRVEIWGMRTYVLSAKDHAWHLVQDGAVVDGAAYREDFSENAHRRADMRRLGDGRISVTAGNGFNFHFWPRTRAAIDPSDVRGIFVTVKARLVQDNPTLPDDREHARYLLSVGADYWRDTSHEWAPGANTDVAIGRFKYVRIEPRSFNMTTLSESELRANPPPLE